jgi:hypothetical protein
MRSQTKLVIGRRWDVESAWNEMSEHIKLAWSAGQPDDFDLKNFALGLLQGAKQNLARDGDLASVAFVVAGGQIHCYAVTFNDHKEKEVAYRDLVKIALAAQASALITCNDAYWKHNADRDYVEGYYPGKLAAEHAKECLMLTVSGPSMETWCIEVPYERSESSIEFGEQAESFGEELGFLEGWRPEKPRVQ